MNKIILINRLDPTDESDNRKWIFFMIGEMNNTKVEEKLVDVLEEIDFIKSKDAILKYNGVTLFIEIKDIPKVNKIFMENNFSIYSIYEIYDPEL